MDCVVSAVVEKRLGALPVAAEFSRRLDMAEIIDRLCPGRETAYATHGQVIEVLVANRLTAPAPLWRVGDWARDWAVEKVFGIESELLNDDRLGRALDAIAPHLQEITGTMTTLRQMAGPKDFPLVGDSKLISYANVNALIAAGTGFIAPAPASKVSDSVYAALDLDEATIVDYVPLRDEDVPNDKRETYRVLEDVHVLAGPRKRDPKVEVRRILVHSTGNARGERRAREKRLAMAREELDKLQRGAGGRYYNTAAKVAARIGVISKTRRVAACLRTEITVDDTGRPTLTWHFDTDVLQAEQAVDGWYALPTTLTPEQADPAEVLRRYKGQGAVERRYSDFKGPLAVTPIFVQDNKRLAALITVICLALLLYCLIERQVRRSLGPEQKMRGLYPGNQAIRPTGRMILYHLSGLRLRVSSATDPPTVAISRGVQLHLLDLLGLEPTHPRWPET
jgi:transposase